jgi:hypothetical protein
MPSDRTALLNGHGTKAGIPANGTTSESSVAEFGDLQAAGTTLASALPRQFLEEAKILLSRRSARDAKASSTD